MTEPETPGSDPTQLRTRAVRDGDGYVLDGHKWFTSNGSIADFLIVMAVTDPDAAPHRARLDVHRPRRHARRRTSCATCRTWSSRTPHYGMLGGHTEILYEDVRLGPDALLGEEGDGFLIAQHRLVPGRIHHCMRWLGRRAARLRHALRARALPRRSAAACCATSRRCRTGSPTRRREMQAARLMTLHAAWKIDRYGSSAARTRRLADQVLRRQGAARRRRPRAAAHGGLGYSTDMPLEMLYRYARHARFVDGADEVHRESVARQILRAYEAPGGRRPDRVRADAARGRGAEVRRRARRHGRRRVSMQAVQLVRWQAEPELREVDVPEPGPGEVLVKIAAAGLCHSDLHIMEWPEGTLPWSAAVHARPRERRARSPRSAPA